MAQLLARLAVAAAQQTHDPSHADAGLRSLGMRLPASRWAELRDEVGRHFTRTDDLNLDRKQTILSAFFAIEAATR
ncbi:MAG TPA: hypothetical protein VNF99_06610, partial [Stellaceae bacterium]|nr:hypothetical protein [Stellaceae bacterium]